MTHYKLVQFVQHLTLTKDVLLVNLSRHFCTSSLLQWKTKLSPKKIKDVQYFDRMSEEMYGRSIRIPRSKAKPHKDSESAVTKKHHNTRANRQVGTKSCENNIKNDISNRNSGKNVSDRTESGDCKVSHNLGDRSIKTPKRKTKHKESMLTVTEIHITGEDGKLETTSSGNDLKIELRSRNSWENVPDRTKSVRAENTSTNTDINESPRGLKPEDISGSLKIVSSLETDSAVESISRFSLQGTSVQGFSISEKMNKCLSEMRRTPGVGAILHETMSEESKAVLERWTKKMVAQLGEKGFLDYKTTLFANGNNFHEYVASQLTDTRDVHLKPENEPLMQSLGGILSDVSGVEKVEDRVYHSQLGYMGILDGVVRYRDDLVLVEWKTSDKQKATLDKTFDYPLQVAAYMGALNSDQSQHIKVSKGLLVIAYRDGKPATVHPMSTAQCQFYWQFWLMRLQKYWKTKLNTE